MRKRPGAPAQVLGFASWEWRAPFSLRGGWGLPTVGAVKFSVKSDYAARAVLSLARSYPRGEARKGEELAAEAGVPANYLVQILVQLKAEGMVKSVRGKAGGYLLARPPAQVSFGDLLRAIHGEVLDAPALNDPECPAELRGAWGTLKQQVEGAADQLSFQDLLEHGAEKAKMYYI